MTSIQPPDRIVPVDRNGRVRMPAAQRSIILAEFAASGMTGVAFAAHIGVKYPTFTGWIRQDRSHGRLRLRGRRLKPSSGAIRFLEATPTLPSVVQPLELELPGGARLRIADRSQLPLATELLRSLIPC